MRRETQNILLILVGGALLKLSFTGAYLLYVKPAHQPWLIGGGLVMVALAVVSIARDLLATRAPAALPAEAGAPAGGAAASALSTSEDERVSVAVLPSSADHRAGPDTPQAGGADPAAPGPDGHGDHDNHQDHDGHDGHDHAGEHHHPARSAWLLLLPVLAIFLIAPPALGSDSVMRNDNRAAASRSSGNDGSSLFPPLPPGEVVPVAMGDFAARAAWDSGHSLDGRAVKLTGFIVVQDADVFLARLSIACCAADAFPVKVKLDGPGAAALTNDMWVEAVGRVQPGTATKETDYVPTLTVEGLSRIPQPENPYEQ